MSDKDLTKIAFKLGPDALTKSEVETLWATPLGADLFRVESIPFYVNGVALGDLVSIDVVDEQKWFRAVEERGGHSTIRLVMEDGKANGDFLAEWPRFQVLSCTHQASSDGLYLVDVPNVDKVAEAVAIAIDGERRGLWQYEEAWLATWESSS